MRMLLSRAMVSDWRDTELKSVGAEKFSAGAITHFLTSLYPFTLRISCLRVFWIVFALSGWDFAACALN